jgi:hypothetical protein
MELSIFSRILGFAILIAGVVLSCNPEFVSNKPVPEDVFEAVERRIKWGVVVGFGLLFIFHTQLRPWLGTVAAIGVALTVGILIARFIGIVLDGSVPRQWFWMAVEFVVLIPLWFWYVRQST